MQPEAAFLHFLIFTFCLLIKESLDASFRRLGKFLCAYFHFRYFLVGRQLFVQLLAVLFHDGFDIAFVEVQILGLVVVWEHQSYQLRVSLHDHALHHHCHRVQLVLNLLGVDVLSVRSKQHVLRTSVYGTNPRRPVSRVWLLRSCNSLASRSVREPVSRQARGQGLPN